VSVKPAGRTDGGNHFYFYAALFSRGRFRPDRSIAGSRNDADSGISAVTERNNSEAKFNPGTGAGCGVMDPL